jgi:putative transposase
MARHSVSGMMAFLSTISSGLACRFRSRAELELEVIALRHQLAVLRRQRPGRTRLCLADRLLWVWLYRIWPRCLNIMVLVKPPTVIQCTGRAFASSGCGGHGLDDHQSIARFAS